MTARATRHALVALLLTALLPAGAALAAPPPAAAAAVRPRIGVTGIPFQGDREERLNTYVTKLRDAGAEPVLLYFGDEVAKANLDGILFAGGEDVAPSLYGEAPHPTVEVNAARDTSELAQADGALKAGLPILGICRGSQLLNVKLGGSLVQDIPSQVPGALPHKPGSFHEITLKPGTRLASTVSLQHFRTNSYHHQAVKRLAPGLRLVATSGDGVVEAWEADPAGPIRSWVTGVQFHPEKPDFPEARVSRVIFADFVKACAEHAARRAKATAR